MATMAPAGALHAGVERPARLIVGRKAHLCHSPLIPCAFWRRCGARGPARPGCPTQTAEVNPRLGVAAAQLQVLAAACVDHPQFGQRLVNLRALLFELANRRVGAIDDVLELLHATLAVIAVQVEVALDFREWRAQCFGAQDQNQSGAIAACVDTRAVDASGREQTLVLIKTQGAQGDSKLAAQLG